VLRNSFVLPGNEATFGNSHEIILVRRWVIHSHTDNICLHKSRGANCREVCRSVRYRRALALPSCHGTIYEHDSSQLTFSTNPLSEYCRARGLQECRTKLCTKSKLETIIQIFKNMFSLIYVVAKIINSHMEFRIIWGLDFMYRPEF
jgi:hypothetical protein